MGKLLSILLLAVLCLPFLAPLLASGQSEGAGLPICCRRTGQHHCATAGDPQAQGAPRSPVMRAPAERCPYCPASLGATHPDPFGLPGIYQAVFAGIVSHPALAPQTESKRRISRDRSRQKRGPPVQSL